MIAIRQRKAEPVRQHELVHACRPHVASLSFFDGSIKMVWFILTELVPLPLPIRHHCVWAFTIRNIWKTSLEKCFKVPRQISWRNLYKNPEIIISLKCFKPIIGLFTRKLKQAALWTLYFAQCENKKMVEVCHGVMSQVKLDNINTKQSWKIVRARSLVTNQSNAQCECFIRHFFDSPSPYKTIFQPLISATETLVCYASRTDVYLKL